VALPPLTESGELPLGIQPATLRETLDRFGAGSQQRIAVARRLARIYHLAIGSGSVARFVVFGSFVTDKREPNDVDVFMLMDDSFDASTLTGDVRLMFDHTAAQAHFGASIFWLRRLAAFEGEQTTLEYWQAKRGGGQRGIVEIIPETT
jgi:hypothetical protein